MVSDCVLYYIDLIKQVNIGNYRGRKIFAKPIFILTIIDVIERKCVVVNHFQYEDLQKAYSSIYKFYIGDRETPMCKPFNYMQNDGFWHCQMSDASIPLHSAKAIRDNVEYAYLDNALWDLLQDKDIRELMKSEIIRFFKLEPNN